jgi:hypothetical protein
MPGGFSGLVPSGPSRPDPTGGRLESLTDVIVALRSS